MLQIINALESDQIVEKPLVQDCYDSYKSAHNWFLTQGPDIEFYLDVFQEFKGKVFGCYVYGSENKLTAVHKLGNEKINIEFTKNFEYSQINQFINKNRFGLFDKLNQKDLQDKMQDFSLGIFVFNPKNETQKQQAKKFRNIIKLFIQQKGRISDDIIFTQTIYKNQLLKDLFKNYDFNGEQIKFLFMNKNGFSFNDNSIQEYFQNHENDDIYMTDLNMFQSYLENCLDGNNECQLNKWGSIQQQKDDFDEEQFNQEMKDEL